MDYERLRALLMFAPYISKAVENSFADQATKVVSEACELKAETLEDEPNHLAIAEEAVDVLLATCGILRRMDPELVESACNAVAVKNEARCYEERFWKSL